MSRHIRSGRFANGARQRGRFDRRRGSPPLPGGWCHLLARRVFPGVARRSRGGHRPQPQRAGRPCQLCRRHDAALLSGRQQLAADSRIRGVHAAVSGTPRRRPADAVEQSQLPARPRAGEAAGRGEAHALAPGPALQPGRWLGLLHHVVAGRSGAPRHDARIRRRFAPRRQMVPSAALHRRQPARGRRPTLGGPAGDRPNHAPHHRVGDRARRLRGLSWADIARCGREQLGQPAPARALHALDRR